MSDRKSTRFDWDEVEIVVIPVYRPRCPHCASEKYRPIRGTKSDDGSATSRRQCENCSERYIVISEPA